MLLTIYNKLYKAFGRQHWWPLVSIKTSKSAAKRGTAQFLTSKQKERAKFEVFIGAILTQNTAWKNVAKAIANLKKENLIDAARMQKTNVRRLAKLIKPAGYYNQKAERLKIAAEFFLKNKNPERNKLLDVKGIGQETADSILLYAYKKPVFVIDAYTRRILSRAGLCKEDCDYNELQQFFHRELPKDAKLFNEYHALLVELAKRHCTKKPVCGSCPVNKLCKRFI